MSVIEHTMTRRVGVAKPGPVELGPDGRARAALVFDEPSHGPGLTVWFSDRQELLSLLNACDHQLTRLRVLEEHHARTQHPASQPDAGGRPLSAVTTAPHQLPEEEHQRTFLRPYVADPAAAAGRGNPLGLSNDQLAAAASGEAADLGTVMPDPPRPAAAPPRAAATTGTASPLGPAWFRRGAAPGTS